MVDNTWMPPVRLAVAYVERNGGAALQRDAVLDGFRCRRRLPLERGVPRGRGTTAVMRLPRERPALAWDSIVRPF